MIDYRFPEEFQNILGKETVDFAVCAKRKQPLKKSLSMLLFGAGWTAFTSIFVFAFLGPVFQGGETHFSVNGVPTTASIDNFQPLVLPTIIIGVFVLIGLGMMGWGIYSLTQKGGYFAGTPDRLIQYNHVNIQSYDWEQFTGTIETNFQKGDITLQLRTGKMVSRKNRPDEFVPDVVYISGIPDVMDIENKCRVRIKENDPTPAIR